MTQRNNIMMHAGPYGGSIGGLPEADCHEQTGGHLL